MSIVHIILLSVLLAVIIDNERLLFLLFMYKSIEEVVGYKHVLDYGGEVKVLGEVANLSTSHLIAKIRQTDSDSTN